MAPAEITEQLISPKVAEPPLVFVSHDSRDGELAEAFTKLIKSVSAGMLRSFRSSDRKGNEGIEFGDEWYKAIMAKLECASDVVCLLTDRSLDRPWLLYEAGVAKGKLGTPVHGVALGVALSRASTGPFYQFQNSDDSEESLSKLVLQLCRRVQGLEPEMEVVRAQVLVFKSRATEVLGKLGPSRKIEKKEPVDEAAVAKVLEEMKLLVRELPVRLEQQAQQERISIEHSDRLRPRRPRKPQLLMLEELSMMLSRGPSDPIGILIMCSVLKEEFPWLYEIAFEAYRSAKSRPGRTVELLGYLTEAITVTMHMGLPGMFDKETGRWLHEFSIFLKHYISRLQADISSHNQSEKPQI
jgi:hypothetical protein